MCTVPPAGEPRYVLTLVNSLIPDPDARETHLLLKATGFLVISAVRLVPQHLFFFKYSDGSVL